MKMPEEVRDLEEQVSEAEDNLSEAVTELWKIISPTSEEVEVALREHEDNWNPTDLDVLRNVMAGRYEDFG
jgi:hypothetical protein